MTSMQVPRTPEEAAAYRAQLDAEHEAQRHEWQRSANAAVRKERDALVQRKSKNPKDSRLWLLLLNETLKLQDLALKGEGPMYLMMYEKDLLFHDRGLLAQHSEPPFFLWLIREAGTYLFLPDPDISWLDANYQQDTKGKPQHRWYWWQQGSDTLTHMPIPAAYRRYTDALKTEAERGAHRWRYTPLPAKQPVIVKAAGMAWSPHGGCYRQQDNEYIIAPQLPPVPCTCEWCQKTGKAQFHWAYRLILPELAKAKAANLEKNLNWVWAPSHDILRKREKDDDPWTYEYHPERCLKGSR